VVTPNAAIFDAEQLSTSISQPIESSRARSFRDDQVTLS
jgi:hypothetical protein